MKARYLFAAWGICLGLTGCATRPVKEVQLVEVVSAKPYRFITFTDKDDPGTIREIKRHNRTHQAVVEAETARKLKQ